MDADRMLLSKAAFFWNVDVHLSAVYIMRKRYGNIDFAIQPSKLLSEPHAERTIAKIILQKKNFLFFSRPQM